MQRRSTFLLSLSLLCLASAAPQDLPLLDSGLKEQLLQYIKTHYQTPEEYVVSKFKDHDVLFLGENHYIRHDPELVQRLIPLLHKAGIHYLGYEFARRVDQPLIDSLLSGPHYDEGLARQIVFRQYVFWGFQEYVDVYWSAWMLNRSLPAGSRMFRILGLNNSPDWSFVKTPADRESGAVMQKVWHGEDEGDWAGVIFDSVLTRGEKSLVYCGAHHALTEYRQPIVVDRKFLRFGDVRVGNHVFNRIGKRAITVLLHAPWVSADGYDKPYVYPADGYIDAVMEQIEPEFRRVGFETKGTPFGRLPGGTSLYQYGYPDFALETICDGYVFQRPFAEYRGVTAIQGFVNASNIEQARTGSPDPGFRSANPEDFYKEALRDADITARLPRRK